MNITYKNIPIICDIQPKNLWIPFGVAMGCYALTKLSYPLLAKCLENCFPRDEDSLPLANYRTRIRRRILDDIDNLYPLFAHFIRIALPENLHIAVFIISIIQLKESTSLNYDSRVLAYYNLAIAIILLCGTLTWCRELMAISLELMSDRCRFSFVANILKNIARFVNKRQVVLLRANSNGTG